MSTRSSAPIASLESRIARVATARIGVLLPVLVIAFLAQTAVIWIGPGPWFGADGDVWGLLFGQLFVLALTAVLIWRVALVARYRPVPGVDDQRLPTLTVIVPAYNEGSQVEASLRSLLSGDYPQEKLQIIAIDDGSRDDTWMWMQRAAERPGGRLELVRCEVNRGKRHALYDGFCRATGEVVVTVDSDSEVLPNALRNLVSPLVHDSRIAAVAGNVRVLNHDDGPLAKMLELTFTLAFEFMRASESEVATVMCCPGALSAYRRAVIDEFRDAWIHQTFLGAPAAIGEDRSMTNHVLRRGYDVRFQSNAIVLTKVPTTTAQLARMFLRWARSNVRESLVMAGFAYRRFRAEGQLGPRVNLSLSLIKTSSSALVFVPLAIGLVTQPGLLPWLAVAATVSALVPAAVFASTRYPRGALWAFPYALYSVVCLAWILPWALLTPHRSGWLTRQSPGEDSGEPVGRSSS